MRMARLAEETEATLGGAAETALYVDESSFVKKGEASVGVQRQYCGRLGKLENCQVGVFAALGRGPRAALVDFRLFLPEAWARDPERCAKAKVPETERVHRTKTELALAMVVAARARGSSHQWVGGDEVYGNNHAFTAALDEMGEVFLMDVASNLRVWENDPGPRLPRPKPGKNGRPRTRAQATPPAAKAVSVQMLTAKCFAAESHDFDPATWGFSESQKPPAETSSYRARENRMAFNGLPCASGLHWAKVANSGRRLFKYLK